MTQIILVSLNQSNPYSNFTVYPSIKRLKIKTKQLTQKKFLRIKMQLCSNSSKLTHKNSIRPWIKKKLNLIHLRFSQSWLQSLITVPFPKRSIRLLRTCPVKKISKQKYRRRLMISSETFKFQIISHWNSTNLASSKMRSRKLRTLSVKMKQPKSRKNSLIILSSKIELFRWWMNW